MLIKKLGRFTAVLAVVLSGSVAVAFAQDIGKSSAEQPVAGSDPCAGKTLTTYTQLVSSAYNIDRWQVREPVSPEVGQQLYTTYGCLTAADQRSAQKYYGKSRERFGEYALYRTVAKNHCSFNTGVQGRSPADGEYYGLDCNIVCGESGGSFRPPDNPTDGYGQWIGSSWTRWKDAAQRIQHRLERRFHVRLHFHSTAGGSGALEQHVVAWLSAGNDTWYGWKPLSACR